MRVRFYCRRDVIELTLPDVSSRQDVVEKAIEIGAVMYTPLEESHVDGTRLVPDVCPDVLPRVPDVLPVSDRQPR